MCPGDQVTFNVAVGEYICACKVYVCYMTFRKGTLGMDPYDGMPKMKH